MSGRIINDKKKCKVLLKDLMDSVKECQNVYGKNKTLLATEQDVRILKLCTIWEICLSHGLKTTSVFKNIVSGTLSESTTFWDFAFKHLTGHEKERFNSLRYVLTDQGKVRALIRAALNERALERYILTWLSDASGLAARFETWAFLRDNEATNLLPSIAAGLGSILFAITVDSHDINKPTVAEHRMRSEEIIIAVPTVSKERKSAGSKKAQIISFEGDEVANNNVSISSPLPVLQTKSLSSTCLKYKDIPARNLHRTVASSNESIFDHKLAETLAQYDIIHAGSPKSKYEETDYLEPESPSSIRLCGSLPSYSDSMKETESSISKATDSCSSTSNSTGSTSSRQNSMHSSLSSVHQAHSVFGHTVEVEVEVESARHEARVRELEDRCATLEKRVTELSLENSRLKALHRNLVLSRNFSVTIPRALLQHSEGPKRKKYYAYEIHIIPVHGGDKWTLLRRYNEFHKLHKYLQKDNVAVKILDFPPKKSFGNMNAEFVEQRRQRLQVYLSSVLSMIPEISKCNTRSQLETVFPFFK